MLNRVPFATKSASRPPLTSERLVNLFVEKAPADAKAQTVLLNTPGQVEFCNIAGDRGLHKMSGVLYAVSGTTLYSVDSAGTQTNVGTVPGEGLVYMADNGTQLCIVSEPSAYIYTVADGVVEVTDVDFPGASTVAYQDGYFIFTEPDTGRFFICALLDGTSYAALDYATAESHPDYVVRVISDHRELWLFGEDSTEIWYNSGAVDFPFARASNAILERGCIAANSVVKMDNSLVWLADDLTVRRANGYEPARISNHGMETEIEAIASPENAVAWTYTQEGHTFYVLTFPGVKTFVYDASVGVWHERKTYNQDDWAPQVYCYCYNKHLVGGLKIYSLDRSAYTDDGTEIIADIYSVPYGDNTIALIMRRFQLDIAAGVGIATGQGSDPQAVLRFSDDGGNTWSDEIWESIGAVGKYSNQIVWRRLGRFRQRILHIRISDPVKRNIMGGFIEYG